MSQWSRTTKPSGNVIAPFNVGNSANIFGVDRGEVGATAGVAQPGWVYKKVVGSRTLYETLVAMKNPPAENNATAGDDTSFADFVISILAQPSDSSTANANVATSFTVVAAATPADANNSLLYQWQTADNVYAAYANVSNGNVYSGANLTTLSLANTLGLEGHAYRVIIISANAAANVTAEAVVSDAGTVIYV